LSGIRSNPGTELFFPFVRRGGFTLQSYSTTLQRLCQNLNEKHNSPS
jgi:hypothetical protein